MSKTDKTKPFYLKLAHGDLAWKESHDHTDGLCDLPPVENTDSYWKHDTSCYRTFVYTGIHACCCHRCHSSDEYMLRPGKRQRLKGKRIVRDWEKEYIEA